MLTFALAQYNLVEHEFVYINAAASSVSLAGTFNGWNKESDPMKKSSDGKSWGIKKNLAIGKYQYKFVVDGQNWFTDPKGDNRDDGYGNVNSFLNIIPVDFVLPAKKGDGIISKSVISHDAASGDFVYNPKTNEARFLARARKNDIAQVELHIGGQTLRINRVAGDENLDIYSLTTKISDPSAVDYLIRFIDGKDSIVRNVGGIPIDATKFEEPNIPDWTQSAVFYQIFPDRFDNGNKVNDPANVSAWDSKPTYSNFMGGDLAGVSRRISYLSELGITGIYFNPIFTGPSNHGYETTDYMTIEPRLGTNPEFSKLTKDLKKQGISVILDGVFNHSSVEFAPFREIRDKGADASTLDWYTIKSFPVVPKENPPYEAWAGFESLPKLNVMNPATKQYIFEVLDYWHSNSDIAGWRLDVANEMPMPFLREFRTHVKASDPSAWIIGENWSNSSAWLKGDQWDSSMNYPLRGAILNHIALGTTSSSQFLDDLMASYLMYGPRISGNMLNSLSTHDVPRFKNLAKENNALSEMGAVALFAWPGVPCVYYGDELGMTGGVDPDNRRGMRWDLNSSVNKTLQLYKKLIKARKGSVALQVGEPIPLFADDTKKVSAFARVAPADMAIACFNRSDKTQTVELDLGVLKIASTKSLVDVVSGKTLSLSGDGRLRLVISSKSALLAISRQENEPLEVLRDQKQLEIQR